MKMKARVLSIVTSLCISSLAPFVVAESSLASCIGYNFTSCSFDVVPENISLPDTSSINQTLDSTKKILNPIKVVFFLIITGAVGLNRLTKYVKKDNPSTEIINEEEVNFLSTEEELEKLWKEKTIDIPVFLEDQEVIDQFQPEKVMAITE